MVPFKLVSLDLRTLSDMKTFSQSPIKPTHPQLVGWMLSLWGGRPQEGLRLPLNQVALCNVIVRSVMDHGTVGLCLFFPVFD